LRKKNRHKVLANTDHDLVPTNSNI